jgi:serine/threonine protein kinase
MSLTEGTRLGPYEILGPLGAGGMGEVYRARDTRLGRDVALKILPKETSADPDRKQRFEREAKMISSLNHPHICTLHDIGSQDGQDYLVMECVDGETLAKRLEKGPLSLEQMLKYGAQIADALDKAHRSGIVRDAHWEKSIRGKEPAQRSISHFGKGSCFYHSHQAPDAAGPGARDTKMFGKASRRTMAERR